MRAISRERYRLQEVDAVRQHAGMGDQQTVTVCENGTEDCLGPNNAAGELPCPKCFVSGGDEADA